MPMNCVNCGRALYDDRCKVRCPHCGYFEDCSDPSAPGDWSQAAGVRDGSDAAADAEPDGGTG